MTKGCRLLPLYQTSPIPLHLEVLQTLTSFFCLVLFVLHQLASPQLQLLDPQAMHQPGYQTGRMNLESLVKPCYLLWSRKKHVCWQKFFCWSCIWKQKKLKNLKKESRGNQFVLAAHLVAYQIHDKHQIQKVFRSTAIDQIPASQWITHVVMSSRNHQTKVLLDWFYYKLFAKLLKKCYSPCLRWNLISELSGLKTQAAINQYYK